VARTDSGICMEKLTFFEVFQRNQDEGHQAMQQMP
jgi:hypothetical protein